MVNIHHCDACGWETKTPDHVIQVFHPCHVKKSRRQLRRLDHDLVAVEEDRRREWARAKLGPIAEALETELGPDVLLREVEE